MAFETSSMDGLETILQHTAVIIFCHQSYGLGLAYIAGCIRLYVEVIYKHSYHLFMTFLGSMVYWLQSIL